MRVLSRQLETLMAELLRYAGDPALVEAAVREDLDANGGQVSLERVAERLVKLKHAQQQGASSALEPALAAQ